MIAHAFPSERAYLTKDGRRLLEERIQLLTSTVEELQEALEEPRAAGGQRRGVPPGRPGAGAPGVAPRQVGHGRRRPRRPAGRRARRHGHDPPRRRHRGDLHRRPSRRGRHRAPAHLRRLAARPGLARPARGRDHRGPGAERLLPLHRPQRSPPHLSLSGPGRPSRGRGMTKISPKPAVGLVMASPGRFPALNSGRNGALSGRLRLENRLDGTQVRASVIEPITQAWTYGGARRPRSGPPRSRSS